MGETKKNFWQNMTFWVIILLIVFTPAGLFLMWYYKKEWNKNVKIGVTIITSLFFVYALSQPKTETTSVNTNTSITQKSNDDVKNKTEEENKRAEEEKKKVEEEKKIEAEKKRAEEQTKIEEEKKIEAEKKKAEEQAKIEEEKRNEAEKKRAEEQARVEAENQAKATQNTQVTPPKEHYASCKEMKEVHPNGAKKGDAWYDEKLDRDKDGYACE